MINNVMNNEIMNLRKQKEEAEELLVATIKNLEHLQDRAKDLTREGLIQALEDLNKYITTCPSCERIMDKFIFDVTITHNYDDFD